MTSCYVTSIHEILLYYYSGIWIKEKTKSMKQQQSGGIIQSNSCTKDVQPTQVTVPCIIGSCTSDSEGGGRGSMETQKSGVPSVSPRGAVLVPETDISRPSIPLMYVDRDIHSEENMEQQHTISGTTSRIRYDTKDITTDGIDIVCRTVAPIPANTEFLDSVSATSYGQKDSVCTDVTTRTHLIGLNLGDAPVQNNKFYSRAMICASPESRKLRWQFPTVYSPNIVFFDLETTVPIYPEEYHIVQFGSVEVDPMTMKIVRRVSEYVRCEHINAYSVAINKISVDDTRNAKTFGGVADIIYDALNDRIWAGHDIIGFDIPRLIEEFHRIGRSVPKCRGIIDTYSLYSAWAINEFTTNLRLETLAEYFGVGQETHDAYDDALMAFLVLKKVFMFRGVMMLVSDIPDMTFSGYEKGKSESCIKDSLSRRTAQKTIVYSGTRQSALISDGRKTTIGGCRDSTEWTQRPRVVSSAVQQQFISTPYMYQQQQYTPSYNTLIPVHQKRDPSFLTDQCLNSSGHRQQFHGQVQQSKHLEPTVASQEIYQMGIGSKRYPYDVGHTMTGSDTTTTTTTLLSRSDSIGDEKNQIDEHIDIVVWMVDNVMDLISESPKPSVLKHRPPNMSNGYDGIHDNWFLEIREPSLVYMSYFRSNDSTYCIYIISPKGVSLRTSAGDRHYLKAYDIIDKKDKSFVIENIVWAFAIQESR